jgi:hypothetical protein
MLILVSSFASPCLLARTRLSKAARGSLGFSAATSTSETKSPRSIPLHILDFYTLLYIYLDHNTHETTVSNIWNHGYTKESNAYISK